MGRARDIEISAQPAYLREVRYGFWLQESTQSLARVDGMLVRWNGIWLAKYNTKKMGASVLTLFVDWLHVFDVVRFVALFCCFFLQPPQAINSLKDKSTATKLQVVVVQFRRSSPQSLLYWYFSATIV